MRLEELDFAIPASMIAQRPAEPRDSCRLFVLGAHGVCYHRSFVDLPAFLGPRDTLVLNDSRVIPARVHATKPSGGGVELLFLRALDQSPNAEGGESGVGHNADELGLREGPPHSETRERWEVLARPSHRLHAGTALALPGEEMLVLREALGEGRWVVEGPAKRSVEAIMESYGKLPLPPYIKVYPDDPATYQTVYAAQAGSAAAPTAGLHFTPSLLEQLKLSGVRAAFVTLHVGLDTFQPIRETVIEQHRIHTETYSVSQAALETIRSSRPSGGRLVAVGTTAARVLETLAATGQLEPDARPRPVSGQADLFITPGYRFKAVDALLTNFHLPRSTLLAMVMAFAGVERIRRAYAEAIELGYRFFSFGDAMLIEAPAPPGPGERRES